MAGAAALVFAAPVPVRGRNQLPLDSRSKPAVSRRDRKLCLGWLRSGHAIGWLVVTQPVGTSSRNELAVTNQSVCPQATGWFASRNIK